MPTSAEGPPALALRQALIPAAGAALLLAALGGRYGLHRDEWYFVEAGHHPALSYPDQPALVPLAARAWYGLVGGQVWAFRLVPAVLAAVLVVVAAATCRQLGGGRGAQGFTAAATATSSTVLAAAHLFSTTVVDAVLTAATVLALVRAVRTGRPAHWIGWGVLLGVALNAKLLPGLVAACCVLGLLAVGPREWLRGRWPWLAGLVAAVLVAPVLGWQSANGWPQLHLADAIAHGGSGTSAPRWLILPLLLTLTGPLTFWVVVVGLVAGWRSPRTRWLVLAAALLLVIVVAAGGKPYYLLGLLPAVLALAGEPVRRWTAGRRRRRAVVAALLVGNLLGGVALTLPVVPVSAVGPLRHVNYDLAEQIGWPHLVDAVERAQRAAVPDPGRAVIVTSNYGEAGALAAARRAGAALAPVYSGHNAFGAWGPPPAGTTAVLWVGPRDDAVRDLALGGGCRVLAPVGTPGVDNDEGDAVVSLCPAPADWGSAWSRVRHLG